MYQGKSVSLSCRTPIRCLLKVCFYNIGREASTGRKVAIKKIKVGQFKDGLDMSAIREVKYLRELKHQNIIEVRVLTYLPRITHLLTHCDLLKLCLCNIASGRLLLKNKLKPRP